MRAINTFTKLQNSQSVKKSKGKVQGVSQFQAAAFPRHQEDEEIVKTKHVQIEQTYEKH